MKNPTDDPLLTGGVAVGFFCLWINRDKSVLGFGRINGAEL